MSAVANTVDVDDLRSERGWRSRPNLIALSLGVLLLVACAMMLLVRYDVHKVATTAMSPQLQPKEWVLTDTAPGGAKDIRRGDVVTTDGAGWADVPAGFTFVLRVVGVGGDTVVCCDKAGHLSVNGQVITEDYASGNTAAGGSFTVTVPRGSFFLLGDDRDTAVDSRIHLKESKGGLVAAEGIVGRVAAVVLPTEGVRTLPLTSAFKKIDPAGPTPPSSSYLYLLAGLLVGLILVLFAIRSALGRLVSFVLPRPSAPQRLESVAEQAAE